LLIVTGGCLLAFTQEYRASAAMARPSRLLLTATAVVSLLAVSLPYAGAVAQAFGFLPLPLPLLMLVAGFAGHHLMMTAYRHAVAAGYRFYSYGDAMLIL